MFRRTDLLLVLVLAFLFLILGPGLFPDHPNLAVILGYAGIIVPIGVLLPLRGVHRSAVIPYHWSPVSLWALLLGLAMILPLDFMDQLIQHYYPMDESILHQIESFLMVDSLTGWMRVLLISVIIGPVSEEILFRGFAYAWFRQFGTVTLAVVHSSLIFSLFHFNPYWFLQLVLFGFVLALLRWRTGSLLVPILVHSSNNLISLLDFNGQLPPGWRNGWSYYGLILISLIAFAGIFRQLFSSENTTGDH